MPVSNNHFPDFQIVVVTNNIGQFLFLKRLLPLPGSHPYGIIMLPPVFNPPPVRLITLRHHPLLPDSFRDNPARCGNTHLIRRQQLGKQQPALLLRH